MYYENSPVNVITPPPPLTFGQWVPTTEPPVGKNEWNGYGIYEIESTVNGKWVYQSVVKKFYIYTSFLYFISSYLKRTTSSQIKEVTVH